MHKTQILEARALLDEMLGDEKSPLNDQKHPKHAQVSHAVADLEAEIVVWTLALETRPLGKPLKQRPPGKLSGRDAEIAGCLAQETQANAAKMLGCSASTVWRWLKNKSCEVA